MATALKLRRGTTSQHASFTGSAAEVTVDTDKNTVVVHNGSTAGGFALARASGSAISVTSLSNSGNLTFTGTGNRITGDFSNATVASRVAFQTSTANSGTFLGAIPNGTIADSTGSGFLAFGNSDVTSSNTASLLVFKNLEVRLSSGSNTGTFYPLTMYTGGSERLRIDTSGNVGIGTSSPQTRVQIASTAANTLSLVNNSSNISRLVFSENARPDFTYSYIEGDGRSTGYLAFRTNDTERMRLDSAGNVGIGTSSPATRLDVTATGANGINITSDPNTTTDSGRLFFSSTGGTYSLRNSNGSLVFSSGATVGSSSGTERMRIDSSGNVGIGTSSPGFAFDVVKGAGALGRFQNTASTNAFIHLVDTVRSYGVFSNNGAWGVFDNTASAERMRIDSSGNLLVGTTNSSLESGLGFKFRNDIADEPFMGIVTAKTAGSNTNYHLYSTGAGAFRFYVGCNGQISATSTSITAISDVSLKKNIRDLDTGLAHVLALKPRRFDWKEETKLEEKNVAGFIAQELEEVLPELVYEYKYSQDETKKAIKMGDILPTLVKAIQEQQAIITDLKARIETLESK